MDGRRAQYKQDLALVHANVELIQVFGLEGIALLNVLLIDQATARAGKHGNHQAGKQPFQ
jgi:hypothetical protein